MLGAASQAAGQQAIVDGLGKLERTVGDPESGLSPAAMLGALRDSVHHYAAAPDDLTMARAVLDSARDMSASLRSSSATVQQARQQADADMVQSVAHINDLLSRFETLNGDIVRGTHAGADITDKLDARDRIMAELSEEIGLRIVTRPHNDIALYTDSGVTLFETKPRAVTLEPTTAFDAGTNGKAVFVDGVPVIGGSAAMPAKTGRLVGLATFRDTVAATYQSQLDEIARGLVEVFADTDRNAPATLPDIPGLFTYSGAPAMPASGTLVPGLAAEIAVNPNVDPEQGGSLSWLRDGGIGDPGEPGYNHNISGASAFSGRLQQIIDAFDLDRSFDPASGADQSNDLVGFAASSVGWLEASRQNAAAEIDYRTALFERSREALSNATGVNIEEEMTIMLELERSYQASAKLISTVDSMFASLLNAVR
jgi:flagellar hook-associated protein 1 FlgK